MRGLVSGKEEELAVAAEKQVNIYGLLVNLEYIQRVAEEIFATERANQDRKLDELAKEKVEIADQLRRSEQRIDVVFFCLSPDILFRRLRLKFLRPLNVKKKPKKN